MRWKYCLNLTTFSPNYTKPGSHHLEYPCYTGWPIRMVKTSCWLSSDSFGSCWAATVATYCPGRVTEHPKCKSTGGLNHPDGSPCTNINSDPNPIHPKRFFLPSPWSWSPPQLLTSAKRVATTPTRWLRAKGPFTYDIHNNLGFLDRLPPPLSAFHATYQYT